MEVLIVDAHNFNNTKVGNSTFAINVRDYLRNYKIDAKIIKLETFLLTPDEESNLIFSGSFIDIWEPNIMLENLQQYLVNEIRKKQKRSIIGICFGAQMIAKAVDSQCLSRLPKANNDICSVKISGSKTLEYFAFLHQDYIKSDAKGLNILASDEISKKKYIQVFTLTKNKNFYGFQFHPEIIDKKQLQKLSLEFHIQYNNSNLNKLTNSELLFNILNKNF